MKFCLILLVGFLSVSCASQNNSTTKINSIEVSEKLVKGTTTQADVLKEFGTPDIIEKTPEGDLWGYNRHSNESNSMGASAAHYIASNTFWNWTGVGGSTDQSSSSSKTASLTIVFNKNKILSDYSFRSEKF